jgi:two-component system sensor histidine kinase KdpD
MAAAAAAAERKAEATELRTTLLSAVGHDLRTPLTSIKAAIGSLRAPDLSLSDEDTEELMEAVEVSADRLAGLIDNLLDSSRLATGAVTPHLRPVGYDEVVAHALSNVDNSQNVRVSVDARLPSVQADPGLLERVIANVLDNALRHGGGDVSARASAHSEYVELRIVDHGKGLRKGAAESAFAPFQRLGGDRDSTPGVGLGLSVAKGFTEAMGGTVRAEDTPGGGLTVVISLPACTGRELVEAESAEEGAAR